MVCTECGLVLSERVVDMTNEWRNFSESDKDRSRAEVVDEFYDDLAVSKIASTPFSSNKEKVDRLNKIQSRNSLSAESRVLAGAFSTLKIYADRLNLTKNVRDKSKSIYQQLYNSLKEKNAKMTGFKSPELALVVIDCALKECDLGRPIKDLCLQTGVNEKKMRKCLSRMRCMIKEGSESKDMNIIVMRYCSNLNLDFKVQHIALKILNILKPILEGKNLRTISAVSIYMATLIAKSEITEIEIADVTHLSIATIKKVYKEVKCFQSKFEEEYSKMMS